MATSEYINYQQSTTVSDAVKTRRSLRAFLPTAVDDALVKQILETAGRAPSGTNVQPWHAYVVTGAVRTSLCEAVCDAFDDPNVKADIEVPYYPEKWFEPFLARRRKIGWDLYGLLGIKKGDREKTHHQHRRNYLFFDAPVGLIFTVHRDMNTGSWLDYGMYLQSIMLLAREAGLHTCPQAAWNDYHSIIRQQLSIDNSQIVVCGMALGYADETAIENTLVSERADVDEMVTFVR